MFPCFREPVESQFSMQPYRRQAGFQQNVFFDFCVVREFMVHSLVHPVLILMDTTFKEKNFTIALRTGTQLHLRHLS